MTIQRMIVLNSKAMAHIIVSYTFGSTYDVFHLDPKIPSDFNMVWWVDSDRYCVCRSKFFYHETVMEVLNDRIFQSTNIMFSLDSSSYDKYQILSLTRSGVNIFNVDRTVHGEDFFQKVKEVINDSEHIPELYLAKYRSPIGLAITMNTTEPVDIDERVDIIILKDVKNLSELLEFKTKHKTFSVLIMLWIKLLTIEDLKSMIQFTDGVYLDINNNSSEECYLEVIKLCKQAYKPIFLIVGDIIKDYKSLGADDFHVLAIVNKIVEYQFDGVMIYGNNNDQNNESKLVRSMVIAMDVLENNTTQDIYKLSLTIKGPVLPWIGTSLAASLAAKQSAAGAIIVLTSTGMSARWIANASPQCHIIAITTRKETARKLHLYRKVIPLFYNQKYAADWSQECWNRVVFGTTMALHIGLCSHGDKVVVLAPSDQYIRHCNSLQIISVPLKCED